MNLESSDGGSVVKIRRANERDIQVIMQFAKELSAKESTSDPMVMPVSKFQDRDWLMKNILAENSIVFVAEREGALVGYVLGWIDRPCDYRGQRGYICDCFVSEGYRHKGIGTGLCNAILEWFREKGVWCVESDVHPENHESIKMFEGLGFKEVSKRFRLSLV